MNRVCGILLLISIWHASYAQNIDSIHQRIASEQNSEKRFELWKIISSYWEDTDNILEFQKACIGEYQAALQSGNDTLIAQALASIGSCYECSSNLKSSLDYNLKSLNLFEKLKCNYGIALACEQLSVVYDQIGNSEQTIAILKRSEPLFQEDSIKHSWIPSGSYNHFATAYLLKNRPDSALYYAQLNLSIIDSNHFPFNYAKLLHQLFEIYNVMNDTIRAKQVFHQGLSYAIAHKDRINLSNLRSGYALFLSKHKRHLEALNYVKPSFYDTSNFALKVNPVTAEAAKILAILFSRMNRMDSAYHYLSVHSEYMNEIRVKQFNASANENNFTKQLQALELQEELNRERNRANTKAILLGCLGLLSLGLIFFIYNNYKTNKQKIRIAKSDAEKELLLKEIHHRVKNNLAVISGLLELQSDSIDDDHAKSTLLEGQNRVRSIGLIHQKLYQHDNLANIELHEFVHDLYRQLAGIFLKKNQNVHFENTIPITLIDVDTSVPLGLILNELFTNSFKYALTETGGRVLVTLEQSDDLYQLIYRDTGPGIPMDFNVKSSKSLGLRLIQRLSKQIGGKAIFEKEPNYAKFVISFKDKSTRKNRV